VDVVLQYDEAPDRFGKPDRLLAVKKNRLTGDVSDGIDLWFDPESKRITERKDDFSWETDRQTYIDVTGDEEVPW
jgi:hypothetical protein